MPDSLPHAPTLSLLCAEVLDELSRRLEGGENITARQVLAAHPSLASHPGYAAQVVLAEVRLRRRRGEHPDLEAVVREFPHLANQLRVGMMIAGMVSDLHTPGEPAGEVTVVHDQASGWAGDLPDLSPLYRRQEALGEGGMGVVFRAERVEDGAEIAIKVMQNGLMSGESRLRFRREAEVLAWLAHPNIVRVLGVGTFEGRLAYVMPFYPGGSLARRLGEFTQPRQAVELMLRVCQAVGAAHAAGVVHRDLKPGNVLLDAAGTAVVADFGLARLVESDEEVTRTGQVMGTYEYMSPEQAAGQGKHVGPASDVWSLGVMLYYLLTGQKPFPRASGDWDPAVLYARGHSPIRQLRPELPRDLEAVVERCLQRDPAGRYCDAGELAEELGRWLDGKRVRASRVSWLKPRLWSLVRWARPFLLPLAVLALLALLGAGWRFWPQGQGEPGKPFTPLVEEGEGAGSPGRIG